MVDLVALEIERRGFPSEAEAAAAIFPEKRDGARTYLIDFLGKKGIKRQPRNVTVLDLARFARFMDLPVEDFLHQAVQHFTEKTGQTIDGYLDKLEASGQKEEDCAEECAQAEGVSERCDAKKPGTATGSGLGIDQVRSGRCKVR